LRGSRLLIENDGLLNADALLIRMPPTALIAGIMRSSETAIKARPISPEATAAATDKNSLV